MDTRDILYKAYRDTVSALQKQKLDRKTQEESKKVDHETDSQNGDNYRIVVDLEWVEAIESRLRNIDGAIRENRRFIEQTEEIVPISRSRKITSESIKHLARHTNLISSVEDGKVTPERILNVQRDESFAIYENRFLYTLLQKLSYFVGTRYQAIRQKPEHAAMKLNYGREFETGKNHARLSLNYMAEDMPVTKFRMDVDPGTLPDIQRVARIQTIIMDFMATPLMKELTGCEQVRPPIMRTNLLSKDPNFREALNLWTFIETYQKDGYSYVSKDYDGRMDEAVRDGIYDMTTMLNFVVQVKSNPPLEQQLVERLQQNEKAEKKRALEEEYRRQQQEQSRLDAVRKEERALWQENVEEMRRIYDKKLQDHQTEIDAKLQQQKKIFSEQMAAKERNFQEQSRWAEEEYNRNLIQERQKSTEEVRQLKESWQLDMQQKEEAYQASLAAQQVQWQSRLDDQKQKDQTLLEESLARQEEQKKKDQRELEEELQFLRQKYAEQKQRFEREKSALERSAREDREKLIAQKNASEQTIRSLKAENAKKLRTMQKEYKKALAEKAEKENAPPVAKDNIFRQLFH